VGSIFHTTSDTEGHRVFITKERLRRPPSRTRIPGHGPHRRRVFARHHVSAKLLAWRDKQGFRPLCYGRTPDGSYVVASESCALDAVGARFERDLAAGEILVFDKTACVPLPRTAVNAPAPSASSSTFILRGRTP
jgi:amidophosphoribosyltransferase